jgi:WD40 repeat protein
MFEPDSAFALTCDETGAVLIDRDGRYFRVLLNYMRHGSCVIDPDLSPLGVYEEARFFGLHELAAELDPMPPPCLTGLRRVAMWDGQPSHPGTLRERGVKTLLALADDSLLSGTADGRVTVWHPHPGGIAAGPMVAVAEYRGHLGAVCAIALAEPVSRLFTASYDQTVKVWPLPPPFNRSFSQLSCTPPSQPVGSRMGSPPGSTTSSPTSTHASTPTSIAARSRSNSLSTVASHASLATFSGHEALVSGLVCHLGWCVTASHDQALRFWPWGAADAQPAARALHHAHQSAILALSHVRGLLVSSAADGSVGCWDMETGVRVATLSTCAPKVLSLLPLVAPLAGAASAAAGPGGSADAACASLPYHLCSGDGAGILKLWKLERSSSTVHLAASSTLMCESCESSWAVVRSACTDAPCTGVAGVLAEVVGAMPAAAADQSAGDDDREVSLLEFLAERAASECSVKAVQALALAPQQRLIAAAGDKVSIWHLPSARSEEAAHCRLGGFQYAVTALAASEQGVFAGTSDGQIHAIAWQK